ncbi:MAG: PEP-CTERM system histidine kinase PrsK, partial [Gammaproteobacteria bacterium]|nr:PEP-CTERM system histidine kinase PrsK [Gammaproteobacteria bacterium]
FNTVKSSLTRMNKMLAVLRRNPAAVVQHTPVNLAETLERAMRLCAGQSPQPALAASDASAVVLGDADQLCDVLGHLIQNAQEATGEHGTVELRLTSADAEAVLEVIDDGCGMDQEFIDQRLFRPFDTTKGNAGMGIGVYQARQLVNSLGGDIDVSSRPGEGTRFTIRLPLHDNVKEALSA